MNGFINALKHDTTTVYSSIGEALGCDEDVGYYAEKISSNSRINLTRSTTATLMTGVYLDDIADFVGIRIWINHVLIHHISPSAM